MTFELPDAEEEPLRTVARQQGRDVRALIEEAVRQYLDAAAITDVSAEDIAETQARMAGELGLEPWEDNGAGHDAPR